MKQPKGKYPIGERVDRVRQLRPGGRAEGIVKALKQGILPNSIALEFGVTYTYVMRVRKAVGLNPAAGAGRNIVNASRASAKKQAVLEDLGKGLRVADIAERFGLTPSRVYQIKAKQPPEA